LNFKASKVKVREIIPSYKSNQTDRTSNENRKFGSSLSELSLLMIEALQLAGAPHSIMHEL
jgi:hypothetical protein